MYPGTDMGGSKCTMGLKGGSKCTMGLMGESTMGLIGGSVHWD